MFLLKLQLAQNSQPFTRVCDCIVASYPGSPPARRRWTVRKGRAWYPFAHDAMEQTSQIYMLARVRQRNG